MAILPGLERAAANEWVDFAIPTGLGEARNALVVRAADALVAGPLAQMAMNLQPVSNEKARDALGWTLRYPSWREGFRAELG